MEFEDGRFVVWSARREPKRAKGGSERTEGGSKRAKGGSKRKEGVEEQIGQRRQSVAALKKSESRSVKRKTS